MIFKSMILILSIVVWACIGNAFSGIVRAGLTQTPGLQIVFPRTYQLFVYFLIPMVILSLNSGQLMNNFKMLPFIRVAIGVILTVDWVYLAFVVPNTVTSELTGAAQYSTSNPVVHVVNFPDLILFFAFNLFSFVVIAIFSEITRTYQKTRGL